jgi:hypothetical protein
MAPALDRSDSVERQSARTNRQGPLAKASPAEARAAAVDPPGPHRMVGLGRLELPTSRLSGVRSNHLSYRPEGSRTHVRPERKRNGDGGIPPDGA